MSIAKKINTYLYIFLIVIAVIYDAITPCSNPYLVEWVT